MKSLSELLNLRKKYNGVFGIEVEVEGKNLPGTCPPEWNITDDGSLRGRFPNERSEFVLTAPLDLQGAISSVNRLREHLDQRNAELDFSFRTSVHVHVNVQDLTIDQYLNMLYTYLLLEVPLVRYCGDERVGNRFCLRLQDAEGFSFFLTDLFRGGVAALLRANMEELKYASVNVAATPKYGSLEFRAMQGNLNPDYITTWIRALNNIRQYAIKMKNPQAIHDEFVKSKPSNFMKNILADVYNFFAYDEEEDDMRMAFSLSIQLPYEYTDDAARRKIAEDKRNKRIMKLEEEKQERINQLIREMEQRVVDLENLNIEDPVVQDILVREDVPAVNARRLRAFNDIFQQPVVRMA